MIARKAELRLIPAAILNRMTPGRTYKVFEIAECMKAYADAIRPLLMQMAERGELEIIDPGKRTLGFLRPEGQALSPNEMQPSGSIAGPRAFTGGSGLLVGYDEEFKRRAALCMLVRQR